MKQNATLIVGRFQPFHKGHEEIVNRARRLGTVVIGIIGRDDDMLTKNSPFPSRFVGDQIKWRFGDCNNVHITFLRNGNLIEAKQNILARGLIIDAVMCGPDRFASYDEQSKKYDLDIKVLRIPEIYNIRGTQVRQALVDGDREEWARMMGANIGMVKYKRYIK